MTPRFDVHVIRPKLVFSRRRVRIAHPTPATSGLSFPRKRESMLTLKGQMDFRFRGNDTRTTGRSLSELHRVAVRHCAIQNIHSAQWPKDTSFRCAQYTLEASVQPTCAPRTRICSQEWRGCKFTLSRVRVAHPTGLGQHGCPCYASFFKLFQTKYILNVLRLSVNKYEKTYNFLQRE